VISAFISTIWYELREPDDFPRDWYGWVTNQAGHSYIVGIPPGIALQKFGLPLLLVPIACYVGYCLIWERLIQRNTNLRDSLEDTLHVSMGATVMASALAGSSLLFLVLLVQGILIAQGAYVRWRDALPAAIGDMGGNHL